MSTEADGRHLRLGITVLLALCILAGTAAVLAPLRQPLCWAAVLAFLLQPLQLRLSQRLGQRPALAAGILTALAPVVLLLPLLLLGMAFAQQASNLVAALQANPDLWNASAWQDPLKHPHLAQSMMWLEAHLGLSAAEVYTQVGSVLQTAGKLLAGASGQFVLGAAGTLLQFFLMVFILYFLLFDGAGWLKRVSRLLPLAAARRDSVPRSRRRRRHRSFGFRFRRCQRRCRRRHHRCCRGVAPFGGAAQRRRLGHSGHVTRAAR